MHCLIGIFLAYLCTTRSRIDNSQEIFNCCHNTNKASLLFIRKWKSIETWLEKEVKSFYEMTLNKKHHFKVRSEPFAVYCSVVL